VIHVADLLAGDPRVLRAIRVAAFLTAIVGVTLAIAVGVVGFFRGSR